VPQIGWSAAILLRVIRLPRFPDVQRVFLFGSVLHPGRLRSTSDVDVAIEGKLDAQEYFTLWRELERAAPGWLIDLVELGRDLHFAALARERGELIYGHRFRHLFRSAYRLRLDAERLALVYKRAQILEQIPPSLRSPFPVSPRPLVTPSPPLLVPRWWGCCASTIRSLKQCGKAY
jgi:predicted nucleotidyltransferase